MNIDVFHIIENMDNIYSQAPYFIASIMSIMRERLLIYFQQKKNSK